MCVRVWVMWLFITKKHTSRVITKSGLNMCCRDIWKDMYFEMHARHHELNVCNAHQTSWAELKTWKQNVDTANILYFNTPSFVVPTTLSPAMAKTVEFTIGWSTSHHIQPHWIIKFPQRHWCCRASFMRCQTSHQPSHALFALASIGNLCFYFPPHSGFSHPMHRWQHCCQRCIGWKFHLLLQHQWWTFFFFTHRLWHANRPQRLLWSQNLTHGNQKSALAITTSCY